MCVGRQVLDLGQGFWWPGPQPSCLLAPIGSSSSQELMRTMPKSSMICKEVYPEDVRAKNDWGQKMPLSQDSGIVRAHLRYSQWQLAKSLRDPLTPLPLGPSSYAHRQSGCSEGQETIRLPVPTQELGLARELGLPPLLTNITPFTSNLPSLATGFPRGERDLALLVPQDLRWSIAT